MIDYFFSLWAVVPPLLLLAFYFYRIPTAPSLLRLLLFFILGAISGLLALYLELAFEGIATQIVDWQQIKQDPLGMILRQLLEIGPIEEGCKLAAVIAPLIYFQRCYQLRPSTIFLFTIATALGFTAEENWIYLASDMGLLVERLISTPVHVMFSAPWGYALGIWMGARIKLRRSFALIPLGWLNAVICHALVNILAGSSRYSLPWGSLSYGLFPFFLWMFWRLEQLLRRVQGKPPLTLISGYTLRQRYWQMFLVVCALVLGGSALHGLFLLAKTLSFSYLAQILATRFLWVILSRLLVNFLLGLLAWWIYRHLRYSARRRFFRNG